MLTPPEDLLQTSIALCNADNENFAFSIEDVRYTDKCLQMYLPPYLTL